MPTLLQHQNERLIAKRFQPVDLLAANELLIRELNADGSPFESKNPNVRHAAAVLLRTAQLQSVGNWFTEQSAQRLDVLEKELLALLRMDDPTDDDEATLDRLFASAASRIKYAYADIQAETKAELEKLSGILKERGMADISAVHDVKSKHGKLPDFSRMPVLGLTLAEHFKAQADGMALKFKAAVRAGLAAKDTLDGLIERVIGTAEAANAFCATGEGGGADPTCGGELYHGTDSDAFDKFDEKKFGSATDEGFMGAGVYLSTDKQVARGSKRIASVIADLKKPLAVSMTKWADDKNKIVRQAAGITEHLKGSALSERLKKLGHDGVVLDYSNLGYKHKEVVVFAAEKASVKSWAEASKVSANEITDDHFINAEVVGGVIVRSRLVDAAGNSFGKMIQSAIQTVANYVEKGVFDGAADEDKATMGWEWNALHDGHVICPECEALDGQRWTTDFEKVDPQGMEWPGFGQRHFGCLCSQLNVDLESESVAKTPLDAIFQAQGKESLNASFGKANTEAFLDGRINGRQLLQQDTWKLSPDALAELKAA